MKGKPRIVHDGSKWGITRRYADEGSTERNVVARLGTDDRWLTKERWHCCGPLKPNSLAGSRSFGGRLLSGTCFAHCRSVLPEVSLHHHAKKPVIVETCDLGCSDAEAISTRDLFISVVPNTSRNGSSGGSNVPLLPQATTRKRPEWIPQTSKELLFALGASWIAWVEWIPFPHTLNRAAFSTVVFIYLLRLGIVLRRRRTSSVVRKLAEDKPSE